MKKNQLPLLIFIISFSLSSCVTKDKYDELNKVLSQVVYEKDQYKEAAEACQSMLRMQVGTDTKEKEVNGIRTEYGYKLEIGLCRRQIEQLNKRLAKYEN